MTPVTTFAGRTVAVFGLGMSGLASCRALMAGGATVVAADDSAAGPAGCGGRRHAGRGSLDRRLEPVRGAGAGAGRAAHPSRAALDRAEGPRRRRRDHRRHRAVRARAGQERAGRTVHRHHRHQRQVDDDGADRAHPDGQPAGMCRWAATSAPPSWRCSRRPTTAPTSIEMSSFQIELTPTLEPTVGILLNVSPDHLDRHGTMENYAGLKARLVQEAEHPIVGDDDDWCRDISERLRLANRTWVDIVSADSRVPHGWYANGTELVSQRAVDRPARRLRRPRRHRVAARAAQHPERARGQRGRHAPRRRAGAGGRRARDLSRACRIAWRSWAGWAPRSSSTTARPPTPTAPPPRSPPSTATFSGSWAASPSRAASPRSRPFSRASPRPT